MWFHLFFYIWLGLFALFICDYVSSLLCGLFSSCGKWGILSSAVSRLLIVEVLLVVGHGFQSTGSIVVVHGLSYSEACGIFSDQGLNPCLLHWHADYLPLSYLASLGFIVNAIKSLGGLTETSHSYSTTQGGVGILKESSIVQLKQMCL